MLPPFVSGTVYSQSLWCFRSHRWAVSVVMTRQNSLPSPHVLDDPNAAPVAELALVPLLDLCNYSPRSLAYYLFCFHYSCILLLYSVHYISFEIRQYFHFLSKERLELVIENNSALVGILSHRIIPAGSEVSSQTPYLQ